MNLPDWATHAAVDGNGAVWLFDREPEWVSEGGPYSAGCGWVVRDALGQCEQISAPSHHYLAYLPLAARLLCVAIPRPEREEREP